MYDGTGKITGGTGILDGATGKVHESGPYILWFGEDGNLYGQYNATYIVRVCMNESCFGTNEKPLAAVSGLSFVCRVCAENVRQLESESPFDNLMEVKS